MWRPSVWKLSELATTEFVLPKGEVDVKDARVGHVRACCLKELRRLHALHVEEIESLLLRYFQILRAELF